MIAPNLRAYKAGIMHPIPAPQAHIPAADTRHLAGKSHLAFEMIAA